MDIIPHVFESTIRLPSPPENPVATMSEKVCEHHDEHHEFYRRLFYGIIGFLVVFGILVFLVWAILRPSRPSFVLQDVTVYAFNVSAASPYILSTNMQVTVATRNPNPRVGIYYDSLDLYATYRDQQITLPTLLPVTYQGHKDVVVWSPFVRGDKVPISPFLGQALGQDLNVAAVLLNVKIDGIVKWKVGSWISDKYHLYVHCPAYIKFGNVVNAGIALGGPPPIKFQLVQDCSVETNVGS